MALGCASSLAVWLRRERHRRSAVPAISTPARPSERPRLAEDPASLRVDDPSRPHLHSLLPSNDSYEARFVSQASLEMHRA